MTAERTRAPLFRAASADGCGHDGRTLPDLFAHNLPVEQVSPHPDFLARAAIWRDYASGLISRAEASRRSATIGAPQPLVTQGMAHRALPAYRPRHARPSPAESRQYAQPMATTAARDDRLTPNAKAFLQVLRARCGKGRETSITKGTMGAIMSRSARTIRRYLVDLVRYGYVELETRLNARGLHLGLTVRLTALVLPFFEEAKGLARWLAESPKAAIVPFSGSVLSGKVGVTFLTSKNQFPNHSLPHGPKPGLRAAWKIGPGRAAAPT